MRWKGYSEDDDSWVKEKDFDDKNIIKKYWRSTNAQEGYKEKLRDRQRKEKEDSKKQGTQKKKKDMTSLFARMVRMTVAVNQ